MQAVAVRHPGRPQAAFPNLPRVESAAVIDHLETESAGVVGEADHDPPRCRVAFDVVYRFLRDSEDDQFLLGVQPQMIVLYLQRRADPGASGQVRE